MPTTWNEESVVSAAMSEDIVGSSLPDSWSDAGVTFIQEFLRIAASTSWGSVAVDVAAPAGRVIILVLSTHDENPSGTPTGNSNSHTSISDTQGNSWVKLREYTANLQLGADVVTVSVWRCVVATGLTTSDTITVNYGIAIPCQAIESRQFTITSSSPIISVAGAIDRNDQDTDPGLLTLSGLPSSEYLFVRATAIHGTPGGADINLYNVSSNYTEFVTPHTNSTIQTEDVLRQIGSRGEFRVVTSVSESTDPSVDFNTFPDSASTFIALQISGSVSFTEDTIPALSLTEDVTTTPTYTEDVVT